MKLVHQINLAFGLLLFLVLTVTAISIHFVLLDHFIGAQKEDMQAMGGLMKATLEQEAFQMTMADTIQVGTMPRTSTGITSLAAVPVTGIDAIITDNMGNIVSGVIPVAPVSPVSPLNSVSSISSMKIGRATAIDAPALQELTTASNLQNIWDGRDGRFITTVNAIPQGTLTLITPVSKITAIEQALFGRLLIVLGVGGALMFLLSLFITKKLIKPLMRLREELKKVKERRFSEVQLIRAGGELGVVAHTVYDLAEELERYSRVQKQFFQNASHELKTPLMSISGYAEGIRDGIFEGESVRKGLDIILSESGRLKNIITEMTLLAKLDSEENIFQSAKVSVQDMLTETIERITPMLVQKGLTMRIVYGEGKTDKMTIAADRDKLLQALLNVLTNATRYANKDICIHAAIHQDRVKISVLDDGAGIPEDLLPYLFHRFVKGKGGENGLGLAISRAIVERCGGLIRANNREEGGAVFTLDFPTAVS
ncbi:Signal transduction histidine kinase [Paenibacillus sp. 1_12]|uniref:sensor histidine kinase n=1 Tax=Paenibacillus sp. 1_12 TaxID=1566278 RepID=UPI0008F1600F|nr:HAMP domain-containing sensor histidine kinase [Paenibacillus sp. 1_12]SFK98095.1 Signal transduction histidine kinase [Paenibacillus sp. 1_12]